MNKKALRKIPVVMASEICIRDAKEDKFCTWRMNCKKHEDIMVVTMYRRKDLLKGIRVPKLIMFFSDDDYITLDVERNKWLTGDFFRSTDLSSWWNDVIKCDYDSQESKEAFSERFAGKCLDESIRELGKWQQSVIDRRRHEREWKELEHTREVNGKIGQLPDLTGWIKEKLFENYHFLIYNAKDKKRIRHSYCTACQKIVEYDSEKHRFHRWEKTKCPSCGQEVVLQSSGLWHEKETYSQRFCYFEKFEGKILTRYGIVDKTIKSVITENGDCIDATIEYTEPHEWIRAIYDPTTGNAIDKFEYGFYKTLSGSRWKPYEGIYAIGHVYEDNLSEVLADTCFKYSGLKEMQMHAGGREIKPHEYLTLYKSHNEIEILAKNGFWRLVDTACGWHGEWNLNKTGILFKLPKIFKKAIKESGIGWEGVTFCQHLAEAKINLSFECIKTWMMSFGNNIDLLNTILKYKINPLKFARYGLKKKKGFVQDWKDYISWCKKLKYDISDPYYSMPPKFARAHDNALNAIKVLEDKEIQKAIEEMVAKGVGSEFAMENKKFLIRLPANGEEIKKEGEALHHCVATYIRRVASGETNILFIRKKETPMVPFYTLEYKNGKVVQCRGMRNCDMTAEVKTFVKAWEEKMKAA